MRIHGETITRGGHALEAEIITGRSAMQELEMMPGGLWFGPEGAETTSGVNDTFDVILGQGATLHLQADRHYPELFCANCLDARVRIKRGGAVVFTGFLEPMTYSQDFNSVVDDLELNCIDTLSALQYSRYMGIGEAGTSHAVAVSEARQRSFLEILLESLATVRDDGSRIWYDGSVTLEGWEGNVFEGLSLSDLLMLGEDEDETWTRKECVEEILRYLNLHITQDGQDYYIFSWSTLKKGGVREWMELGGSMTKKTECRTVALMNGNAADKRTQISIGEVFNRITVTAEREEIENVIESPLTEESLGSPYSNRQKYLTTYEADGEGERAWRSYVDMVNGRETDYAGAKVTDWWMQVRSHDSWRFPGAGGDLYEQLCQGDRHQEGLANYLGRHIGAAIVSWGKLTARADRTDNSVVAKIPMSDYLVVSVNGNGEDEPEKCYPTEGILRDSAPVAEYVGNTSGGVYSPSDEETTNYIVVSGKVVLNPRMKVSQEWADRSPNIHTWEGKKPTDYLPYHLTVPSRTNEDGRYYTRRWWKSVTPGSAPESDDTNTRGLLPFTDDGPQEYEFKYSAIGDGTDRVSKVAMLACMLVIGDKVAVESGTQGQPGDFEWRRYKERSECSTDDEYYSQCITIGFDPKIGDKLIGTEYSIQNNIRHDMGIDAEGMAIPVRRGDRVGGRVRFLILGPVNTMWNEVTRRHPTWFRHTQWGEGSVPLMAHVSSVMLRGLEVKVYSDNAHVNNFEESDLVYMTDTKDGFVNEKGDITFRITSALTSAERRELGVAESICRSTPTDARTGYGLLEVTAGETGKPEMLYADAAWREWSEPRVTMTQNMIDRNGDVGILNLYHHPALGGKRFFVQGISRDLMADEALLNLKETGDD